MESEMGKTETDALIANSMDLLMLKRSTGLIADKLSWLLC
jgi:hypothetical protein